MISTYVAGSHELSPQINYLLHNKLLSSQQHHSATTRSNHHSSGSTTSGQSTGSSATSGDDELSSLATHSSSSSSKGSHRAHHHHHHNSAKHHHNQRRQSVVSQSGSLSGARSRSHSQPVAPPQLVNNQPAPPPPQSRNHQHPQQPEHHQHHHHYNELIPRLPPIRNTSPAAAYLKPLTVHEYECRLRLSASDSQLVERVFRGGMQSNRLRAALWPNLFGLVQHRGHFKPLCDGPLRELPDADWLYVEHPENQKRWQELEKKYYSYQTQWKCITPDQEQRFSSFRERKSLIERDVLRSDRSHPFYAESSHNLNAFIHLLMTYMMYDFDIGYMQGMSDLAAPILYVYQGDQVKSFWVFVEVMRLLRRNFEPSQKTIHFQLSCLYRLIQATDPLFAEYLEQQEASNCFFVFRAIMCQFKRELMKNDEDDYSNVLQLWDTIWCVSRLSYAPDSYSPPSSSASSTSSASSASSSSTADQDDRISSTTAISSTDNSSPLHQPQQHPPPIGVSDDSNQADLPRHSLTDTELFVLALCLSMIRRERDLVLARRLDSTEIHLHFIDPYLTKDLNGFIEHANQIYSYLKNDFDQSRFHQTTASNRFQNATVTSKPLPTPISKQQQQQQHQQHLQNNNYESPYGSAGSYDLLNDFLIINGASGV